MDKLRSIRTFIEVVRERNFAAAAQALKISPSLASKQIAELEYKLGVRLLHRSTRRVDVTDLGQQYYESCVQILRDMDDTENMVRDMQRGASGPITVRASHSITVLYVCRLLCEFKKAYPMVEVDLMIDEHPSRSILAAQRGLDIAIHLGPFETDKLAARMLARVDWNPYASPEYLSRHGSPAAPPALAVHNCLNHTFACPDRTWRFSGPSGKHDVVVGGSMSSNSSITLKTAAEAGLGIALLPSFCVAPYGSAPGLVRLLEGYRTPSRDLHLLVAPDRRRPSRIRHFVDFTVDWFRTPPWTAV